MSGTATERPTVDELVRRAGAWCDRHPGAELLTTYHALARRYGVTPANATTEAPDGGAVPVGEPTGADRRGWEIKEPEPAYPLSERDYHACGRDFTPAAQRRRGLVRGVRAREANAARDRRIVHMAADGMTQRAIAEVVGRSRGAVRHTLDRHAAQIGERRTAGHRRQAAAVAHRRAYRTTWRGWADVAPTGRGPAVRRRWAASHVLTYRTARNRRESTLQVALYRLEHDRQWRGVSETVTRAELPAVLTGSWSTQSTPDRGVGGSAPLRVPERDVFIHGGQTGRRAGRPSDPGRPTERRGA